ncbi:TetR/AcrR family transcriptional regulator [Georgenia sp. AZ-5]|uniref:TetR/AcrR family transcriptional regulator n=1 Tax=Georgenia sp. AZ-5 TaxID=3367526 RepID=UPI00375482A4
MDPRTRRTLDALQRALTELLDTTPLSQVTVSELCRVAGVHRTTFYKHFQTVGELATGLVTELGRRIAPAEGGVTYRAWLIATVAFALENKRTYARLLSEDGDPVVVRAVCSAMVRRMEDMLADAGDAVDAAHLPGDRAALARVLGYSSYAVVETVLAADRPLDPGQVVDSYIGTLPAPMAQALTPELVGA